MKKGMILVIMLINLTLLASEIDLYTTEITSQNHFSFLEEEFDTDNYIQFNHEDMNNTYVDIAVESLSSFKYALLKFFLSEETPSHFIEIHTSNSSSQPLAGSSLYFNLLTGVDYFLNTTHETDYSYVYYGTKIFANIENSLFIDGYWWAGHFTGDDEYINSSPIYDSWSQKSDDDSQISVDNVCGKIVYKNRFASLTVGRGKHNIGNNIGGSVILDDTCNDYGYFSGKLDFKKFSISMMHGTLIPDSVNVNDLGEPVYKEYNDKYIAVKRFDWKPTEKFHFFAGEEVMYGGRSIDPSYLLPHTFLRATEHNLRDRDNVLIFCGLNLKPIPKNTIYVNFIFDEFSKNKIFTDWWGNKYAVQGGNSYLLNKEKDTHITLEFTAVRPWMYSHKILHNKYSHDGIGLGFPGGGNLIQFAGEFNYKPFKKFAINLHSSYTKQGSLGNDFSINYESRPDDTATWLEGETAENIEIRTTVKWQPLTHHRLIVGHSASKLDDNDLEHQLSISYQASY